MPPTRVPRCGALVVVVAAPEHSVPRLRRGRVPASATASGVRVVDVPASREPRARARSAARPRPRRACGRARAPRAAPPPTEPRPSTPSRVLAPLERCPRRPRPSSRVLVVRVPRSSCSSSECGACSRRACRGRGARRPSAAPSTSERPCSRTGCRRGVLVTREPWRPRRGSGRRVPASMGPCARVARAAVTRLRRGSGRARVESAAVLALRVPRPCASVEGAVAHEPREPHARALAPSAAVPPTRERYAGAVGAVSEWWTCLRRACRTDR